MIADTSQPADTSLQADSALHDAALPAAYGAVPAIAERQAQVQAIPLEVAEEMPIALVYNGISHVVLMATPQHLRELAYGFSLSEAIIERASQIYAIDIEVHETGISLQIELAAECFAQLKRRRRQMNGRTGCGLCGIEALSQLDSALPVVNPSLGQHIDFQRLELSYGFALLASKQLINQRTGGCHAAALWQPARDHLPGFIEVFEDVGRHNALDKLIGWRLLHQQPMGIVLLTSRLSYELIQKAAYAQLPLLAAISAPTGMAVRLAHTAGIKLAVFVREGRVTWIG